MAERLSGLDASFLQVEDDASPLHVAAVLVFDGEPPAYDDFVDYVSERLHLVPRYRQRVAGDPLRLGRPRWVDDSAFDLRYHVRATALPAPGGEAELGVLAARIFSRPVRHDRPLWEMWLIEGLEGGRFAVLSKSHHAMVDGISGLDILSALFAPVDEPPPAWSPKPAPGTLGLLAGAVWERAGLPLALARAGLGAVGHPQRVLSQVGSAMGGLAAMARSALTPAPRTPYNRPVRTQDRRFAWARADLGDFKQVKAQLGGTINDVVLTVVARALRRHLERRGEDVESLELRAFAPVSVRGEDQRAVPGNQVSGMVVPLPIGCQDPAECLRRVGVVTRRVKGSGQAVGAQTLTGLAGFAPPTLLDQGARLAAAQRFVNLVVTNVPGPQFPLSLDGHELLEIVPMVPVGRNLALSVAVVSYNGALAFGLVSEFDAVPDLEDLARDVEVAVAELLEAAGVEPAAEAAARRAEPLAENAPPEEEPPIEEEAPKEPEPPAAEEAPKEPEPPAAEEAPKEPEPPAAEEPAAPLPGEPEPHVEVEEELVGEFADRGAEEGAGPELRVQAPWEGYAELSAAEVSQRIPRASDEELAVVELYERAHRRRRTVLELAERELARRTTPAGRAARTSGR